MPRLSVAAVLSAIVLVITLAAPAPASGRSGVQAFFGVLNGFDQAAGHPVPVMVTFDHLAPGTNVTNKTLGGAESLLGNMPAPSAQLRVVKGRSTYTPNGFVPAPSNRGQYKLLATSGVNVLSPGGRRLAPGPAPRIENDDLRLVFASPVPAVGFDVLFQSFDGYSYVAVKVLSDTGSLLYSNSMIPGGTGSGGPGGAEFVGFVSQEANIGQVVVNESDNNNINPDSNIGYDTFRF
jgi:hypothetical protein